MLSTSRRTWPRSYLGLIDLEQSIPLKQCSKCKQELPATNEYFHKDKNSKWGLTTQCKECAKQKARDWLADNPERARESSRAYYLENSETIKTASARNRAAKPEQYRDKASQRYQNNKTTVLAANKAWAEANPDKVNEIKKRYRDKNARKCVLASIATQNRYPDRYKVIRRESRLRNPATARRARAERRLRQYNAEGTYTNADVLTIYHEQDGRCFFCGVTIFQTIPGDYHIDHLMPLNRGGSNWSDNLALSCSYCNCSRQDRTVTEWQLARGW